MNRSQTPQQHVPEAASAGEAAPAARRLPPAAVAAGVAVLALVTVVVVLGVIRDDDGGEKASRDQVGKSPQIASLPGRVAANLDNTPAIEVRGTFTSDGDPVRAELAVTRSGFATGTLTLRDRRIELVAVNGRTFVKAGAGFWASAGGSTARPEDFAGRWAKAPASLLGFSVRDLLAPSSVAALIRNANAESTSERIGGHQGALRVRTARGTYWISGSSPYRLLRVQGAGGSSFDVGPPADTTRIFTGLRERVADLGGARDPGIRFEAGTLRFVNCNENVSGCTVTLPVTRQDPAVAGAAGPRAVLLATITAEGRTLGRCSAAQALGAQPRATLSCTVTSAGWRSWMRRARELPGRHAYQAQARVVGEAVAPDQVPRLLAAVDRERTRR